MLSHVIYVRGRGAEPVYYESAGSCALHRIFSSFLPSTGNGKRIGRFQPDCGHLSGCGKRSERRPLSQHRTRQNEEPKRELSRQVPGLPSIWGGTGWEGKHRKYLFIIFAGDIFTHTAYLNVGDNYRSTILHGRNQFPYNIFLVLPLLVSALPSHVPSPSSNTRPLPP